MSFVSTIHRNAVAVSNCKAAAPEVIASATGSITTGHQRKEDLGLCTIGTCHEDNRSLLTESIVARSCHFEIQAKGTLYRRYVATRRVFLSSVPDQVPEYCQQLRKHIKEGTSVSFEHFQYIDTKQYWKDECNRIHKEKVALESKLRCLEEAQRILKDKFCSKECQEADETIATGTVIFRENEIHSACAEAGVSRKRQAPSQDVLVDQDDEHLLSALHNDKHLQLSGQILRLIRQRTELQKAAQHFSTLDQINILTTNVVNTIGLLENCFFDCCLPLKKLKTNSEDSRSLLLLQQLMHQTALSFLSCFRAMNQLFLTIPGRTKQREVVSRMVMFFSKAVDFLQTVSTLQSEDEQIQQSRNMRNKRPKLEPAEYAVNKYLAHVLVSIAERLEWKSDQTGHSDILEGMLLVVIQHTGRVISDCVFGEHVAASDRPGNISNSPDAPVNGFVRPESRYMTRILHATLGGLDRRELVIDVLARSASVGKSSLSGSATTGDILRKAKKLLQSTLLKSTIGGLELESLRVPRLPTEISLVDDATTNVLKYGKEWLLETVWGLIGWDMVT
ncbi:hypothetical protein ONS95_000537 [Cadophora gregata]|uniref:uncharacterized protein n=1 Tax=Cadophora gregata TaxID=51156 RepID=UPI0026DCE09A|nr:uncharacterized protein ONS95_000537 [Cadophora gregata]KAK0125449.1 hypothetical protein ONS96_009290 [Cadophora gregata f. sp. sojae]KAK0128573.1 hypothetical protein ONS95_000537 [Cadophora gregata]